MFDPDSCPREFASLDTKLGQALDGAIRAFNNAPWRHQIDRLQSARQVAGKPLWGGRRLLWELLRFLRLSEDGEDRRAIDRLQRLTWKGDAHENIE